MADHWERRVPCKDGAGRERAIKVFPSEDNRAVVQVPPGEFGVLTAEQFKQFRLALDQVAIELHCRTGA